MIVVEFYLQFLFVVNSSLRHTGQEKKKKWSAQRILIVRSWLPTPPGFDRFTENSQILTVKGNDTSFFGGTLPSPVASSPPPPPKKINK